jgi:O-antigen/teichoic acid export membrane protein
MIRTLFRKIDLSYGYAFLSEATLGLTFIFYILLARILGPEDYGIFASAVALAAILALFIQFGFPSLMARDAAADPQRGPTLTLTFLLAESLNAIIIFLMLFPIARVLGFEGTGLVVCYLAILAEVGRSAKQTQRAVLRGVGWFRTESVAVMLERLTTVVLAGSMLLLTRNLILVMATLVIVRLMDNAGLAYYLGRKIHLRAAINPGELWRSYQVAFPFALTGVLWVLYYQVDLVMLKSLTTAEQPGYYSAAYRVMEMFAAFSRVLFYVFVTKLARCYAQTPERMPHEIFKGMRLLTVVVLPILLVAGIIQPFLVTGIYGEEFTPAMRSLAIILPGTSVSVFSDFVRRVLTCARYERLLPSLFSITVTLNIGVNLILIPRYGAVGAAVATLLSELVLFALSLYFLSKVGYRTVGLLISIIGGLGLVMTGMPSLMRYGVHPAIALGISLVAAGAIALILWQGKPQRET